MKYLLVSNKLIFLLVIVFLITGCGKEKSLKCNLDSYGFKQDVSVNYNDDNIESIKMTMVYDKEILVDVDSIDEFIESEFQPLCNSYSSYDGVECNINNSEKTIELIIDISDYSKLSQDAKNNLGLNYQNYDDLKSNLKESGYTC